MGWMLSHQTDQIKFPSITTTCPDFWKIDDKGYCLQPGKGNFNRGIADLDDKTPGKVKDSLGFKSGADAWGSGDASICKKKKWADTNDIKWDTVTNVNFC